MPVSLLPDAQILRPGRVYVRGVKQQFLRLICVDEVRKVAIFKKLEVKGHRALRFAIEISLRDVRHLEKRGLFVEQEDIFRESYMSLTDPQLLAWFNPPPKESLLALPVHVTKEVSEDAEKAKQWLASRDSDYELIQGLVSSPSPEQQSRMRAVAFSPATSRTIVQAHAEKMRESPQRILRLLHKFAWFGLDKNALLHREKFKGISGAFVKNLTEKSGPLRVVARIYGERYQGRPRRMEDITNFYMALQMFYVKRDMSLRQTYEQMLKTLYVKRNQFGRFEVERLHVPSFRQFMFAAKELRIRFQLDIEKAGTLDGYEKKPRRGRQADIGRKIGDIYDADGTEFNIELVAEFSVAGEAINTGKPQVVVIFERTGTKAMGWHVYYGNENWKEGYRLALFCALTSKKERLKELGLEDDTAWPDNENIIPNMLYVDNGPGSSEAALDSLDRLNIEPALPPKRMPVWKPLVEGGFGHLQNSTAHLPGAYRRTNRSRDKDVKREAKKYAAITLKGFERILVKTLMDYNSTERLDARMTLQMRREGVMPSPNSMFSWGVKRMGGVQHRLLSKADVYESLLARPKNPPVVGVDGVRLIGYRYDSLRLREHRLRMGCKFAIEVLYHPLRTKEVYWRTPDGALDKLERQGDLGDDENADFGDASFLDIQEYRRQMFAAVEKKKLSKKGQLTSAQRQNALEASGHAPRKQRTKPSPHASAAREFSAQHHAMVRPYDTPADLSSRDETSAEAVESTEHVGLSPKTGTPSSPRNRVDSRSFPAARAAAVSTAQGKTRPSTAELFALRQKGKRDGGGTN